MKGFQEAKQQKKQVGYRTSKRFLRNFFRRKPVITATARPRALGGHQ